MKETQEQKQNTSISDDIIHSYKLLHKYFFKYSIFFITTIIGIFIFRGILKSNATNIQINQENFEFTLKQRALILNFNKQMSQSIDDENMHIDIIQGFVDNEGDYIESMNNLGSYKGYILPKFFSIYKTLPLQDISYFAQETYNSKELDTFIQNILLAKRENNEKQNANIQLPLKETLVETFDLGCVQQQKIYQKICNIHIENFLDSFFVYALRQDYE
ncbi:hypothetical protein KKG31_04005 [Patescibacteria group bacterium]|nr:hypothetical protein [Patescibacteria group bacterium]MBU1758306.1 hypothetical protein [Patescibacteria group bacterium]